MEAPEFGPQGSTIGSTSVVRRGPGDHDVPFLLQDMAELVHRNLAVPYVGLFEVVPGGHQLRLRSGIGWQEGVVGHASVEVLAESPVARSYLTDVASVVTSHLTDASAPRADLFTAHGIVGGASVPVMGTGSPRGVLAAFTDRPRPFGVADTAFLHDIARTVALLLEEEKIRQAYEQRAKERDVLDSLARAMEASPDAPDLFSLLEQLVAGVLGIPAGAVFSFDKVRYRLTLEASWGLPEDELVRYCQLRGAPRLQAPPPAGLRPDGRGAPLPSVSGLHPIDQEDLDPPWRSGLHVPFTAHGEEQGLFLLFSPDAGTFDAAATQFFRLLGQQVGTALQNAWLFEQLHHTRRRVHALMRQVVTTQENERKRLSGELHDDAGQALTVLKVNLQLIQDSVPREYADLRARFGDTLALVDSTLEQLRTLAHALHPPALAAVGLNAAMEDMCRAVAQRSGLSVVFFGAQLPPLSDIVEVSLYRILQEALTNTLKHARASRVLVALRPSTALLTLTVEDNGQGFDMRLAQRREGKGIGLPGMRERLASLGGLLEIESVPGSGTCIVARVPVGQPL